MPSEQEAFIIKIPACTKGLFSLVNSVFAGSKSHFLHDIGLRQSENSAKNSYFSFVEGITDPLCKRGFYYYKLEEKDNTPDNQRKVLELHGTSISDTSREDGFGICYIGKFDEEDGHV